MDISQTSDTATSGYTYEYAYVTESYDFDNYRSITSASDFNRAQTRGFRYNETIADVSESDVASNNLPAEVESRHHLFVGY